MTKRILSSVKQPHHHFSQAALFLSICAALHSICQLFRARYAPAASAFALVCVLSPLVFSTPEDQLCFRRGLRNSTGSHRLNAQQLQMALESLRHKTGFLEMHFDEAGFLTLGDRTRIAGGSATARELLIAAVDGSKVFELENYSHSPLVAFAQIDTGDEYVCPATKAPIEVQPLRLDFADFAQLRGSPDVLEAFDLGLVVLHELAHGALQLRDPSDPIELGDCEEYINRIRRELRFPERRSYFSRNRLVTISPGRTSTVAELVFARVVKQRGHIKTRASYLSWESQNVAQSVTALRPRSYQGDSSSVVTRR